MSSTVYEEHRNYWADRVKIDRYRRALHEVIEPGMRVLDLGSGTRMLALLACEAGAGEVFAVERDPAMALLTREMLRINGVSDRVAVIVEKSTDVVLERPVDVIVGDQLGGLGFTAGVNKYYADAARRLLRKGGTLIPSTLELFVVAVEHEPTARSFTAFGDEVGFDVSPLRELAENTIWTARLDEQDLLSAVEAVGTIDTTTDQRITADVTLNVTRKGVLHGIAGMFRATMSPHVKMSNIPGDRDALNNRWQDVLPVTPATAVQRGDIVSLELLATPTTVLVTWRVTVKRDGREVFACERDTFRGTLLDPRPKSP